MLANDSPSIWRATRCGLEKTENKVAGETGCELWEGEPAMDSERCEAWQNGIVSARHVI
jgi:hypothetical protein